MNILHLTISRKGGAGIAAYRLHEALIKRGIKSAYLSQNLTIDFDGNEVEDTFFIYKKPTFVKRLKLKLQSFLDCSARLKNKMQIDSCNLNCEITSLPFGIKDLHLHPLVQQSDIINLHWIGFWIDYQSFFTKVNKPFIWTLHDMNPFQGIFHYRNDEIQNEGKIGNLNKDIRDLKKKIINNIQKLTLVAPSKWMLDQANYAHFYRKSTIELIPNIIDFNTFKLSDKQKLRAKYKIEAQQFTLLFVADNLGVHRKGFDLLVGALEYLKYLSITLVMVGEGELPKTNFNIFHIGKVDDPEKMADYYAVADLFILPSREDNLPNVMLESLACGTPLVAFNSGGVSEYLIPNKTGVIATEFNGKALADAISNFYKNKEKYNTAEIRAFAMEKFNEVLVVDKYIEAYKVLV